MTIDPALPYSLASEIRDIRSRLQTLETRRISGGSSITIGGSDSQILYNNAGSIGGSSSLTFDDVTGNVTMAGGGLLIQRSGSEPANFVDIYNTDNATGEKAGIKVRTGSGWSTTFYTEQNNYWHAFGDSSGTLKWGFDGTTLKNPSGGAEFSGNVYVSGTTPILEVEHSADSGVAEIRVQGTGQGTGVFYAGQSNTHGGGIFYNGDGSPSYATGESADRISFYRRNAGTNEVVFDYPYNSNTVTFRGDVVTDDLTVNCSSTELKVQGGVAGIQFISRNTGNRYVIYNSGGALRFWEGSDRMTLSGSNLNVAGETSSNSIRTDNGSYTASMSSPRWDCSFYVLQSQHWYGHNSTQTMYLGESGNTISIRGSLSMNNKDINGVNWLRINDAGEGIAFPNVTVYQDASTSDHLWIEGKMRARNNGNSSYWYEQCLETASTGSRGGLGMWAENSNNSAAQLRPTSGYLYVRTWNDGTGIVMRAGSYQNYSTIRDKQDVTDWGATSSVGAAVDPDFAIDATEMIRQLRPVKFRRTKHHRLSADVQNKSERRGRALDRLNDFRKARGLEEYVTEETVHQCGRDCDGSPESPCKLYRDWEKGEIGFIAEEVVEIIPDAVWTDEDEKPLTIDPMALITMCVKALKEIDTRLTSLEDS